MALDSRKVSMSSMEDMKSRGRPEGSARPPCSGTLAVLHGCLAMGAAGPWLDSSVLGLVMQRGPWCALGLRPHWEHSLHHHLALLSSARVSRRASFVGMWTHLRLGFPIARVTCVMYKALRYETQRIQL